MEGEVNKMKLRLHPLKIVGLYFLLHIAYTILHIYIAPDREVNHLNLQPYL